MEAFQYKYDINGSDPMVIEFTATTGTTFDAGDIIEFAAGGTVQKAIAGSTRIAGIAVEGVVNAPAGKQVQINVGRGAVYKVSYTTGVKTSLTGTDIGVAFDLAAGQKTIALDDTTGGMCRIVAYDNVTKSAEVLITSRLLTN